MKRSEEREQVFKLLFRVEFNPIEEMAEQEELFSADLPESEDLFMNSDAMIHDCGSFTAEYLYTQRPVMFYTHDRKAVEKQLNELGMAALDAHYIGGSADDIESFIKDVVIGENDPKVSARKAVYDKYLLPPNGRSTAENIYHDLLSSLGFEK